MVFNDGMCYTRSWLEISRMKAATLILIYEKQPTDRRVQVQTRLDFSHGSAGATCSWRSTQALASRKLATDRQRSSTCRSINMEIFYDIVSSCHLFYDIVSSCHFNFKDLKHVILGVNLVTIYT